MHSADASPLPATRPGHISSDPDRSSGGSDVDLLFLVRHADAGDKRGWDGPDALRPLSATGSRQATDLVVHLEDYPVERILCSPTLRCHQTVQPLARDRILRIERVAALGVDASPTEVLELFWDRALHHTVLCTHGETIAQLFTRLVADGLVVGEPLQWPKGSVWLLHRTDQRGVSARSLSRQLLSFRPAAADLGADAMVGGVDLDGETVGSNMVT